MEQSRQFAIQSFAKQLLDVADNLGRAVESIPPAELEKQSDNQLLATLLEGVRMTDTQLQKVFHANKIIRVSHLTSPLIFHWIIYAVCIIQPANGSWVVCDCSSRPLATSSTPTCTTPYSSTQTPPRRPAAWDRSDTRPLLATQVHGPSHRRVRVSACEWHGPLLTRGLGVASGIWVIGVVADLPVDLAPRVCVCQVLKHGYKLHDRVIRPAQVRIDFSDLCT